MKPTDEMVEAHARKECKLAGILPDVMISCKKVGTVFARCFASDPECIQLPVWQWRFADKSRTLLTAALAGVPELQFVAGSDECDNGVALTAAINITINEDLAAECAVLKQRVRELEEALQNIRSIPPMPFPDPIAHSWHAYGTAIRRAYCNIQNIASEVLKNC